MKILITTRNCNVNGVNTFIYTLCEDLVKGHEIYVHCQEVDENSYFYRSVHALGVQLQPTLEIIDPDLILFNYNSDTAISSKFPHAKRKFIVHGLTNPDFSIEGLDVHEIVCMSKRQYDFLKPKTNIYCKQAAQPINGHRFALTPSNSKTRVLLFDHRENQILLSSVVTAASALGLYVSTLGTNRFMDSTIWKVEERIKNADIVIGYGRSLVEGMFMGKSGIVYGINGGDGLVTEENIDRLMETSFSGYTLRKIPEPHDIGPAIAALYEQLKLAMDHNPIRTSLAVRERFSLLRNIELIIS